MRRFAIEAVDQCGMPLELVTQALDGECLLQRVDRSGRSRRCAGPLGPRSSQSLDRRTSKSCRSLSGTCEFHSRVGQILQLGQASAERARRVDSTGSPGRDQVELPAQ